MDQPVEGPAGGPQDGVVARTDRVAQGVVGVALLAAFVFRVPWLVPVVAVIAGLGALAGPKANGLHAGFERWIAPRLPGPGASVPEARVAASTVRAQDALAAVILLVASFAFVLGIAVVGWLFVVAEAVIAIVAATTRLHVVDLLQRSV